MLLYNSIRYPKIRSDGLAPERIVAGKIHSLKQVLSDWLPDFQTHLAWLVAHDRGSEYKAGVDAASEWMLAKLQGLGCDTIVYPSDVYGSAIAGTLKGRGRGRVLLVSHLDTVWPEGTVLEWPFRIEGTRAEGPGVVDNASGSLAGYYILKALRQIDYDDFEEITLLCNGDEELGSPFSKEVIQCLAQGRDAAFILESPSNPNEIISQRAGLMYYDLRVAGKNAHVGVEPEKGHNAIMELCYKLCECNGVSGSSDVLTVNVSTIAGGRRPNIVPDQAQAQIDVRVETLAEADMVDARFREIADHIYVPGTSTTLNGGVAHPPMARGPKSAWLVELSQAIGRELGINIKDTFCGGTSDGCYTALVGTPTLCGLAPFGAQYHTRQEYLDLSSVVPRATLVAGLVVACTQEKSQGNS